MTFKQDLLAQAERSKERFGPERFAIMEAENVALTATFEARPGLGVGDQAPVFVLPDALGGPIDLSDRLSKGPVVLNFYRGGWCPYCNIELRAYQAALPRMNELGASLMAILPQAPDDALTTTEKNELSFDVLSHRGSSVAERFGIAFELSDKLQEIYVGFGNSKNYARPRRPNRWSSRRCDRYKTPHTRPIRRLRRTGRRSPRPHFPRFARRR